MSEALFSTTGARVGAARAAARQLRRLVIDLQRLLASLRVTLETSPGPAPLVEAERGLSDLLRLRLGPALVLLERVSDQLFALSPLADDTAAVGPAAFPVKDSLAALLLEAATVIECHQKSWGRPWHRLEPAKAKVLEAVRAQHLVPALSALAALGESWDQLPQAQVAPADAARARLFTRMRQLEEDLPLLARCHERLKAERGPSATGAPARLGEARIAALEAYFETQAPAFLAFLTAFVTSDEHSPRGLRLSREDARRRFSPLREPGGATPEAS